MTASVADRLAAGAAADENGCLVWQRCVNSKGYGQISVGRKSQMAHRVAWELVNGAIPPAMTIDHLCRNIRCINVAHLDVVTLVENIRRATEARHAGLTERVKRASGPNPSECPRGHAWTLENRSRDLRYCKPCLSDRRRGLLGLPDGAQHGRVSLYSDYGCRCEPCSTASAIRSAEKYQRRRQAATQRRLAAQHPA